MERAGSMDSGVGGFSLPGKGLKPPAPKEVWGSHQPTACTKIMEMSGNFPEGSGSLQVSLLGIPALAFKLNSSPLSQLPHCCSHSAGSGPDFPPRFPHTSVFHDLMEARR